MELDKIAGHTMPKATPANTPAPDAAKMQSGTLPEFTSLMEGDITEAALPASSPPAPVLPQGFAPATPQKPILDTEATLEAEPEDVVPQEMATKSETPETKDVVAPMAIIMPTQPRQDKVAQTASAAIITATAKTAPEGSLPAPVPSAQAGPPLAASKTPVNAYPLPKSDIPTTPLPATIEAQPVKAAPIAVTAPTAPTAFVPAAPTAPLSKEAKAEPELLRTDTMVKPAAKPKAEIQLQTLPSPLASFSNSDVAIDDPAELQFNIRIDRQVADVSHTSRPSTQAPPVASQITAQLPQALTKTDKQTVELRLDPPELGRVTIHLTTNDQQVTAQVVADRPDTVDLMRRHAEVLAATLARAGFAQADLSFQQGKSQNREQGFEQFQGITTTFESDDPAIPAPTLSGQDGRLDIRL